MNDESFYVKTFRHHFGSEMIIENVSPVPGGCINKTSKVTTNQGVFFIKVNSLDQSDLFHKEQLGLLTLKQKSTLGIPEVIGLGSSNGNSYLILEWIEKGIANGSFWDKFGQRLGLQHKVSSSQFGLDHDNHIGSLPQANNSHESWTDFFIEERLKPQLEMAHNSGLIGSSILTQFDILFTKLEPLVPDEPPSLLHGDLWSGNFLCGQGPEPYIFDPAVYFGHRETELAFTTMFGGFDQQFYSAYSEEYPIKPGFQDRIEIHNLYPLLVHVNLFGPSYLSGVERTLKRFT